MHCGLNPHRSRSAEDRAFGRSRARRRVGRQGFDHCRTELPEHAHSADEHGADVAHSERNGATHRRDRGARRRRRTPHRSAPRTGLRRQDGRRCGGAHANSLPPIGQRRDGHHTHRRRTRSHRHSHRTPQQKAHRRNLLRQICHRLDRFGRTTNYDLSAVGAHSLPAALAHHRAATRRVRPWFETLVPTHRHLGRTNRLSAFCLRRAEHFARRRRHLAGRSPQPFGRLPRVVAHRRPRRRGCPHPSRPHGRVCARPPRYALLPPPS